MVSLILSMLIFQVPSQNNLNNAIKLSRGGDYIGSLSIMSKFKPTEKENGTYHYYKMLNHFFMNDKKNTLKEADYLEGFNIELSEGFKVVTHLVKEEATLWKQDFTDLDDIGRDMKKVKDKLTNGYAGKETQKEQKLIVDRLTKLIEDAENKKNKKKSDSEDEEGQKEQQPGAGGRQPLDRSEIANDSGKGETNIKLTRKLAERWGSLPPRERQQALQNLTSGMSRTHAEAVENYFRNLSGSKK